MTVSQKYEHRTLEVMERAFERLEALNERATASLADGNKRQLLATVSAKLPEAMAVSH